MGADTADILRFVAFGLVWLFPIGLIFAVLSLARADSERAPEEPGPNVVPFPGTQKSEPPVPKRLGRLIKRLANDVHKG